MFILYNSSSIFGYFGNIEVVFGEYFFQRGIVLSRNRADIRIVARRQNLIQIYLMEL